MNEFQTRAEASALIRMNKVCARIDLFFKRDIHRNIQWGSIEEIARSINDIDNISDIQQLLWYLETRVNDPILPLFLERIASHITSWLWKEIIALMTVILYNSGKMDERHRNSVLINLHFSFDEKLRWIRQRFPRERDAVETLLWIIQELRRIEFTHTTTQNRAHQAMAA